MSMRERKTSGQCECGKPGHYSQQEYFEKFKCADCEIKRLSEALQERCKQLGELMYAVYPSDSCFLFSDWMPLCLAELAKMRKQPHWLERGPGINAKYEPVTCDVGADWED